MDKYQFDEAERAIIESSCIPFAVYQFIDKRVVTLAISQGFCEMLGLERDTAYYLMNNNLFRENHPDDVARLSDAALRFSTEGAELDIVYRAKAHGGYIIVRARGKHVFREDGTRLAVVWYANEGAYAANGSSVQNELSQAFRKALREQSLYQKGNFDQLTGLPSMSYFFEYADIARQQMIDAGQLPAVLFFNLADMKRFNQKHGFAEGNALLKSIAYVLTDYFGDYNCSRFGKDQFAVITVESNLEDNLRGIFDACRRLNDGDSLPVRTGIYLDNMEPVSISTACDRAKYACDLYRDVYESQFRCFDEAMLADLERRQYIIDNLDNALESGWIKVFYQPIVRATSGKVRDEEALARWFDPERGFLPPTDFIPILEDARLVYKLDLYVLDQVLAKMKRQADFGFHVVPQSLNLSREDFYSLDIVEEIRSRVDAVGIGRGKLTIEITESTVGRDFEFMKAQIERLRDLGFNVWMDDFGSGYSSLDLLQHIRFDVIKLDMKFMERFGYGDESKIILTELVRMAIGLGIDTVAEGVETEEQVRFLREIGCSKLQGFHYCKPISMDEIVRRNEQGLQIGFENPEESGYYAALGSINLYDPAIMVQGGERPFQSYFDTMPMAAYEVRGDEFRVVRSNKSYREYMERAFGISLANADGYYPLKQSGQGLPFLETLRQVSEEGGMVMLEEELDNQETLHSIVKRVAVNPVSGTVALVVAVVTVVDSRNHHAAITYANIAKALSADYSYLYYVNLDTKDFVEYKPDGAGSGLLVEDSGSDFFATSARVARDILHTQDLDAFLSVFTEGNVLSAIADDGASFATYRQIFDGEPVPMLMKAAVADEQGSPRLIIGVREQTL